MQKHGRITEDCNGDYTNGKINPCEQSMTQDVDEDGVFQEPHIGMEFDSEDAARMFYVDYASKMGFSIRENVKPVSSDSMPVFLEFVCTRNGSKKRGGSCEASIAIELVSENKWLITKFVKDHAHPISHSKAQKLKHRRRSAATMNSIAEAFPSMDLVPSGMMYVSLDGNTVPEEMKNVGNNFSASGYTFKNIGSPGYCTSGRTLGKDAQNLLEYLKKMQAENPGFYYAIQLDEENRMTNVFWSDSRSRTAYSHFGDTVILDTLYRVNQFRVPFAPFMGMNNHGHLILFGCALLLDESQSTFIWLFKTFLAAMNDKAPVSLTTDQDRVIRAAVSHVFPKTRHCINKFHVLREGQERLAQLCRGHPNLQVDLDNCVNMAETIEEFESSWSSLILKYELQRNEWLQLTYDARQHWVPVYFRDSFFAAIFSSSGCGSSFFEGYVNQQTTLPMFFRQYERALDNSFQREVKADFDTLCTTPMLRTPSPMEKQAASVYTKSVFSKFQEELVETFAYTANRVYGNEYDSIYRVAKFEDDRKSYCVSVNVEEMKANCSCKMFEYCGILCRHVLTVFMVTNILTMPSHYFLKRWTRNAKSISDPDGNKLSGHTSFTARYNSLCKEAIIFAEEAATSSETYCAALSALREGRKKVDIVKKSVPKVATSCSPVTGVTFDDQRANAGLLETTPSLWPRQDEIVQRFNLNHAGVPCHPISNPNALHISPVSLSQVGALTNDMVVLPCLKSMTWEMENKNSHSATTLALIILKLQDNGRIPMSESDVKFSVSRVTLEPMLKSMAYISKQLSTSANKVAIINLKLQDTETRLCESEVKFQVSRDTLSAMLRSMVYIRRRLSNTIEYKEDRQSSKQPRK